MAFGERRWTTRTKLAVALMVLAAIATPIVGPFTFYGTLVPYLTPLIPKPDGVPSDAKAAHNWKGPGLYWRWEREFPAGRATWTFVEDRLVSMRFDTQMPGTTVSEPRFAFANYLGDEIDFSLAGSRASHCSIHTAKISDDNIVAVRNFLAQSRVAATSDVERRLIALSADFVDQPVPKAGEHPCGARDRPA
jgi:hypothetical protein